MIATEAGTAIAAACEHLTPDVDALCRSAVESATPVIALVAALRDALPESSAVHVHRGATSQDIVDTAVVLVVRTALALVEGSLAAAVDAAATLADEHRATVMCGRTLLQQAAPTTFGLKAAGWMLDLLDASEQVGDARCVRLPAQLGGAVGTLAAFGPAALAVADGFATRLDLPAPLLPWHTRRPRHRRHSGRAGLGVRRLRESRDRRAPARPDRGRGGARAAGVRRRVVDVAAEAQPGGRRGRAGRIANARSPARRRS